MTTLGEHVLRPSKKKGKAKRPHDGTISPATSEEERQDEISKHISFIPPADSPPAVKDAFHFSSQHLNSLLFKHCRLSTAMQCSSRKLSTAPIGQPFDSQSSSLRISSQTAQNPAWSKTVLSSSIRSSVTSFHSNGLASSLFSQQLSQSSHWPRSTQFQTRHSPSALGNILG